MLNNAYLFVRRLRIKRILALRPKSELFDCFDDRVDTGIFFPVTIFVELKTRFQSFRQRGFESCFDVVQSKLFTIVFHDIRLMIRNFR